MLCARRACSASSRPVRSHSSREMRDLKNIIGNQFGFLDRRLTTNLATEFRKIWRTGGGNDLKFEAFTLGLLLQSVDRPRHRPGTRLAAVSRTAGQLRQRAGLSRRQRSSSGLLRAGQRKAMHQGLAGLNDSERLLARRGRGAGAKPILSLICATRWSESCRRQRRTRARKTSSILRRCSTKQRF